MSQIRSTVNLIDSSNRSMHAETLRSFAELRYEIFIRHLGWPLPDTGNGLEEDEYDSSRTVYVTISNSVGQVVAGARLLDTADASLLNEVFPHLIKEGDLPRSPQVYEITRFAIDHRRERLEGCMDLRARLLWAFKRRPSTSGCTRWYQSPIPIWSRCCAKRATAFAGLAISTISTAFRR